MTKFIIALICDLLLSKRDDMDVYMIVHVAYQIQGIPFIACVHPLAQKRTGQNRINVQTISYQFAYARFHEPFLDLNYLQLVCKKVLMNVDI